MHENDNTDSAENAEPVTQFTNFDEFLDFYSEQLAEFSKNKENVDDYQINIECTVNYFLFVELPKEIANEIVKQISDTDEYSWK